MRFNVLLVVVRLSLTSYKYDKRHCRCHKCERSWLKGYANANIKCYVQRYVQNVYAVAAAFVTFVLFSLRLM